jgi:hypothetical protein
LSAVNALDVFTDPAILDALLGQADDAAPQLRCSVLYALGKYDDSRVTTLLRQACTAQDATLRAYALRGFARLPRPERSKSAPESARAACRDLWTSNRPARTRPAADIHKRRPCDSSRFPFAADKPGHRFRRHDVVPGSRDDPTTGRCPYGVVGQRASGYCRRHSAM